MKCSEITYRPLSEMVLLESNPRTIKKADMDRLVDSIKIYGFWKHRPITLSDRTGKLVVIAGNQRLKAAKKLKLKEVPTVVYSDLTEDEEKNIILRDNINNGEWDFNALQVDDVWKDTDFSFIGLTIPEDAEPKKSKKKAVEEDEPEDEAASDEQEDGSEEANDKEAFYRSMFKDVLYESDNIFEIPNLLLEMQAGKLELPLFLVSDSLKVGVENHIVTDASKEAFPVLTKGYKVTTSFSGYETVMGSVDTTIEAIYLDKEGKEYSETDCLVVAKTYEEAEKKRKELLNG